MAYLMMLRVMWRTVAIGAFLFLTLPVLAQSDAALCAQGSGRNAFQACLRLAQQGTRNAQYNVGLMYYKGEGVSVDASQGAQWLRKSAEQGFVEAQVMVGGMYAAGNGIPKDEEQAFFWYRKAAEQGHRDAQFNLGLRYAQGNGVAKDDSQAVYWYRKSAELGLPNAQLNFGQRLRRGQGVAKDVNEGVRWIRLAAEQGLADAQAVLGVLYADGKDVRKDGDQVLYWLRKAAEQNPKKGAVLGLIFWIGDVVPRDTTQAFGWMKRAADAGTPDAQAYLAMMYVDGEGTAINPQQGFAWMQKAANQGYAPALGLIAEMYLAGIGVAKDPVAARSWLEKAWKSHNIDTASLSNEAEKETRGFGEERTKGPRGVALRDYARALEAGIGGPVDIDLARKLYKEMWETNRGVAVYTPLSRDVLYAMSEDQKKKSKDGQREEFDFSPASSDRQAVRPEGFSTKCKTRQGAPAEFSPSLPPNTRIEYELDLAVLVDPASGIEFNTIAAAFDLGAHILASCGVRLRKVSLQYVDKPGEAGCDEMNDLVARSPTYPLVSVSASVDGYRSEAGASGVANGKKRKLVSIFGPNRGGLRVAGVTLAHEIGHVLGLDHPPHFSPNVMQYRMLVAPYFDEEQCRQIAKSPMLVPVKGAKLPMGLAPKDYVPKKRGDLRQWIDTLFQKNKEVAIFYDLFTLHETSWTNPNVFRVLSMRSGLPIEKVKKIYEYAHNWRADQVLPDANTKFDFSKPAYLPWLGEYTFSDFDLVAIHKWLQDNYHKIAMEVITESSRKTIPVGTSNWARGQKVLWDRAFPNGSWYLLTSRQIRRQIWNLPQVCWSHVA